MRSSLPIRNHEKSLFEVIHVRGPGNSAFLIEMVPSRNVYEIRFLLKNIILGKHRCRYEVPGVSQFDRLGYVLTKPLSDFNLEARRASARSRGLGVESVIEMKHEKQLKFLCSPGRTYVTARKLVENGYEVESSGVHYFPKHEVCLKKGDQALCDNFLSIMKEFPYVVSIHDNIKRKVVSVHDNVKRHV